MKEIKLSGKKGEGLVALVDNHYYDVLSKYRWNLCGGYAVAYNSSSKTRVRMHCLIKQPIKGLVVDHINHDKLDNREENLRVCTIAQNSMNSVRRRVNRSGFKGVSFEANKRKWQVTISVDGKNKKIGTYKNILDAARAYNQAALRYYKEFALLNPV